MTLVDTILSEHLLPLFEGYKLVADVDGNSTPAARLLTAWVELESESVKGSIGVCGSEAALAGTAPFRGIDVHDWAGELVNLAAGRLKYGLLSHTRVRLAQSTPKVQGGAALPAPSPSRRVFRLLGRGGSLRVWVDLSGLSDLEESPTEVGKTPGKVVYFD